MTHEGRMARGKEKISKGIKDIETEYYEANQEVVPITTPGYPKMITAIAKKEKKNVKPKSG